MVFEDIAREAQSFLETVFSRLELEKIEIKKHWNIDHLCFRVCTSEDYLKTSSEFLQFSKLLIESEVNGRLISTFRLNQPIFFKDWVIDVIEVPAPKFGKITKHGFEHFEVVVDLEFEDIIKMYPNVHFDISGLSKELNQELEINFGEYAFKFHHMSLESVIELEKSCK